MTLKAYSFRRTNDIGGGYSPLDPDYKFNQRYALPDFDTNFIV